MLLLYVEVMPTNTTYKNVIWSIVSGANLATIDPSSGLLTANTPNNGGTVTVKATAVDGSGVTATRQITIGRIDETNPTTDIEEIVVEDPLQESTGTTVAPCRKILRDGHIYILRQDGAIYTLQGVRVR